jgi:hypothetical protein
MTTVNIRKDNARRPSARKDEWMTWQLLTVTLANGGHYVNLLTILILITSHDPLSARPGIRRSSNAGKHEARSHDQGSNDCDCGPGPTTI